MLVVDKDPRRKAGREWRGIQRETAREVSLRKEPMSITPREIGRVQDALRYDYEVSAATDWHPSIAYQSSGLYLCLFDIDALVGVGD